MVNRPPKPSNSHLTLFVRHPGPTPRTQPLYRRMRTGAAQRKLSVKNVNFLGAQLRSRHAHRVDSLPPRRSTPSGRPSLVQGRRWVVVCWANQVYLVRFSVDPRPIKRLLPPVRYTTSTGTVRGSWYLQIYVDIAFPRGIRRLVDDPQDAAVAN